LINHVFFIEISLICPVPGTKKTIPKKDLDKYVTL